MAIRKCFLLLLGVLAAARVAAAPAPADTASNGTHACRRTKVLILGAGMAGITAAQALHNRSIDDFVIVEYNAEIGGRARPAPFGQQPDGSPYVIELGANWVQGTVSPGGPENPIWTLAKRYNLTNTYSNYSSILTYDHHGYRDYSDLLDEWEDKYTTVESDAGDILTQNLLDESMRTAFSLAEWTPQTDMLRQAVDWWDWDFEAGEPPEASSHLFGVAGYNATFYGFSEANNFVLDPRGFRTIITGLAATFLRPHDPRLLLAHPVATIAYSDASVTAHTTNGTCITADYALVTFSTGVLQSALSATPLTPVRFAPALPRWKRAAINAWQMATYTKLFFQFPAGAQFWDAQTQFFLYADPAVRGRWAVWQSLSLPGFLPGSRIIFCTVTNPEAARLEAMSDAAVRAEGLAVLRAMFPDAAVPEPSAFMFPRWGRTPWALGSYSNWPTGVSLQQHENYRANVERLWFAGEAGSAEYFGFLQGAYFEGAKAGAGIADCLRGNGTCGERAYEVLRGQTPESEYAAANGWFTSTFETYGEEGDS